MHDLRRAEWRTSTFSGGNGSCVEVASNLPGIIAVRDSKDRQGPALVFTPDEWAAFLAGVRAEEPLTGPHAEQH
jgi:predicted secreted Zn-dependent protease